MKNSPKQIDRKILKTLEPLNRLNPILLDELAAKSIVEEVPADRIICRHGETDARQIYLLSGQIEVATAGKTKTKIIKSKSALKTPIAEGSPRTVTLKTKTDSTLLYIDADLLELLMSDEPELNPTYEVTEITTDDGDDWMLTFLQSPAFLQLPTENIQQLLTHMEEIPVKKDQVVITQGAKDDNYYIIKSGSCNVHRQPYKGSANVLLATIPKGSGFGEEALISNGPRNATITMRENGALMRLKKKDFLRLLIKPLITYFEQNETLKKLDEGCVVIDVRSEEESKQKPLEGSVNIPLSMLRVKFDSLKPEREYLVVCNDGSQSAAAAFLMIQNGLKCSVLKGGLNNSKDNITTTKPSSTTDKLVSAVPTRNTVASAKAKKQAATAKKQTEQIAAQQAQIKTAREKAEQDILKHKKELAESRARIAQKNKQASSTQLKAAQELTKVQAKTKAAEIRQKETNKEMQRRAKEIIEQSAAQAKQTRKQAEDEAALIKQRAIEEAEHLRAEKASQELAKAKAESAAIELQQKETNEAMKRAEEMMKQSAAAAELARKQAEEEATLIKQRAIKEAESLRAEVKAARQKMEQDAVRLKKEEKLIKNSALKIRNEADEIRRSAVNEAQQVSSEIEATRTQFKEKLQRTQNEEKQKHNKILAEAKKQADMLSAEKTQQATAEAEAIRQKAKRDAAHLHNELEQTRKQIEAEAASVVNKLKEQSRKAIAAQKVRVIEEEVLVEVVAETAPAKKPADESVDYSAVSIPGMTTIEPLNNNEAKRKAEIIKAKLAQSQKNKVHKAKDHTALKGDDDLFIFQEPKMAAKTPTQSEQPVVSHRTHAESVLTQISIEPQESVVIYPNQAQAAVDKNNPFLHQESSQTSATNYTNQLNGKKSDVSSFQNVQQFDKQAHVRKHQNSKSNTLAIAASFLLILAGAVFTLHATNTLKIQSIAALFNSGNDGSSRPTAIAKTKIIRKKVLRADTKVNVKKKVGTQMDNIMQSWQNVLDETKSPKKSLNNQ